jgi:hypothetical protein
MDVGHHGQILHTADPPQRAVRAVREDDVAVRERVGREIVVVDRVENLAPRSPPAAQ